MLWLSAALAAIGFRLPARCAARRSAPRLRSTALRSYYLAVAGIERGSLEVLWTVMNPEATFSRPASTTHTYHFDTGDVRVEILPEAGKLDINHATVEQLFRLGLALGLEPSRAEEIAAAIVDWRSRRPGQPVRSVLFFACSVFSGARTRPFKEIEELLQVKGVTPDIFYGTYARRGGRRRRAGGWVARRADGLPDGVRLGQRVDINTAQPAVLAAVGLNPAAIAAILAAAPAAPIQPNELGDFMGSLGVRARCGSAAIPSSRCAPRRGCGWRTAALRISGARWPRR